MNKTLELIEVEATNQYKINIERVKAEKAAENAAVEDTKRKFRECLEVLSENGLYDINLYPSFSYEEKDGD